MIGTSRHSPRARPARGALSLPLAEAPIPELLARCGRRALADAELTELRAMGARLAAEEWREVLAQAREHGMLPLVLAHTARADLLPLMPPPVAEALLDAYRGAWFWNRRLRGELLRMLAALEARGIAAMPVKGVTLAARAYGELALRPTSDLDLLVRQVDLAEIGRALAELGYEAIASESDPGGFYALVYQALAFRGPAGVVVELHWELANLPVYRTCLPAEALWRRAGWDERWGRAIRCLAPADELRYLCFHCAAQHQSMRLLWLVDLVELVGALPADWDWAAFTRETIADGLAMPVWVALARAHACLGLALPPGVLASLRAAAARSSERRRWAAAQVPFHRLDSAVRYLLAQPNLAARWRLAWALLARGVARWQRRGRAAGGRLRALLRRRPGASWLLGDELPPASPTAGPAPPAFLAREMETTAVTAPELEPELVPELAAGNMPLTRS